MRTVAPKDFLTELKRRNVLWHDSILSTFAEKFPRTVTSKTHGINVDRAVILSC